MTDEEVRWEEDIVDTFKVAQVGYHTSCGGDSGGAWLITKDGGFML
jgi:hypothetical protein